MSPMPPQYGYGVAMPSMSPTVPQGSPNQLEALLRAIGVPTTTPPMQPVPPQMPYGGGMGEPVMNFRPRNPQDNLMPPGFVAQPVPMPGSRPEEVFPGPGQQTQGQGVDVQKLMAMLRSMQRKGQTTAPQAPYIPDLTMPIPEMSPADIARLKMRKAAEEAEKLRIMGGMPRMPSPSPVPPSQGGQSAMGLNGLLNALRASRKR